jgi:hypothetical protein
MSAPVCTLACRETIIRRLLVVIAIGIRYLAAGLTAGT